MRPPEELADVDWSAIEHAYGPADDLPGMIRALYAAEEPWTDDGEPVVEALVNNVYHQSTVYQATVAVVPFLAHLAATVAAHRAGVLGLFTSFAEGAEDPDPDTRPDPELLAAVYAELPALPGFLTDPDRDVRRAAIRLAVAGPRPVPADTARTLERLHRDDPDPLVRADALTALALTDPDRAASADRESAASRAAEPEVRLAAALLTMERVGPPYPAPLLRIVAEDGRPVEHRFRTRYANDFPLPGAPADRFQELLAADPDGALDVAERWIAAGDRHTRGSDLAVQVGSTWRDREPRVVAALVAALAHPSEKYSRNGLLSTIAAWMPRAGEQPPQARDLLLADARCDDWQRAAPAQRALAGCGDPRVLDLPSGPFDGTLAVLLTHHRATALPAVRPLLPAAVARGGEKVIDALGPELAAEHLTELTVAVRDRDSPAAARALGDLAAAAGDPGIVALLAEVAEDGEKLRGVRAAAAASHAVLTGRAELAVGVLGALLTTERLPTAVLAEAGRLGRSGAPLVPRIVELSRKWQTAGHDAYWRITGDVEPLVPLLVRLAAPGELTDIGPSGRGGQRVGALRTLADSGVTPPAELRPLLEWCAHAPRRVARPVDDEVLRRLARRLLGQADAG